MEKFRGVDYYAIESLLSEEERMIRDAVRDWVEDEFLPLITEHYRAGTFPVELVPELGELGVFGATLQGYGCAGLSNVAYGLIMQELERGDSGLRSFGVGAERARHVPDLRLSAPRRRRTRWLPGDGERRGDRLLRPHRARLRLRSRRHDDARRDAPGDGCVLNGTKMWITNGTIADVAVVWAKDRRRRDPRLPGRERDAGLQHARHPRQVLAARLDHLRAALRGLPRPGGEPAARA